MERCDACGFAYDESVAPDAGARIVDAAARLAARLQAPGLTTRPAPDVWSPLEYACHVRDVLLVQRERVLLARREDRPEVVPMGRDERVEHDAYRAQDPADVRRQLRDAAAMLAHTLSRLDGEAWRRTVIYNWPERAERSLAWLALNALHEVVHHDGDIARSR